MEGEHGDGGQHDKGEAEVRRLAKGWPQQAGSEADMRQEAFLGATTGRKRSLRAGRIEMEDESRHHRDKDDAVVEDVQLNPGEKQLENAGGDRLPEEGVMKGPLIKEKEVF